MKETATNEIWITAKEAASLMGVSKRMVCKWCVKGNRFEVRHETGIGGTRFAILLTSLPIDAQAKYWRDRATRKDATPLTHIDAQATTHDTANNIWITAKEAAMLMGVSDRTVRRMAGKFTSRVTRNPKGQSYYEFLLTSLPIDAQAKYWGDRATQMDATPIIPIDLQTKVEGNTSTRIEITLTIHIERPHTNDHWMLLDTDHLPI